MASSTALSTSDVVRMSYIQIPHYDLQQSVQYAGTTRGSLVLLTTVMTLKKIYLVYGIVSTAPAGYPSMDSINCEGMCVGYPTRNVHLRHTSLKYWTQS